MSNHVEKLKQEIPEVVSKKEADEKIDILTKKRALDAADRVLTDLTDDPKFIEKSLSIISKDLDIRKEYGGEKANIDFTKTIKGLSEKDKIIIEVAHSRAVDSVVDSHKALAQVEKDNKALARS